MANQTATPSQWESYPPLPHNARPTPPRRRRSKLPFALVGFGTLIAIIVGVSIATNGSSGNQANGRATAISASAAAPLGTEVRDGKFGFVVTGVDAHRASVGDNPYLKRTAQGQYVLVHVDVTNTGDKPQSYFGDNQKLIDSQGRQFANDTAAGLVINPNVQFEINPGSRMSTTLAFDIPKDARAAQIEFHESMFSDGVAAALK